MNLKDKKILVTGSSSGIGQAIAIACAQAGAAVVVHYRKNELGAKETLQSVQNLSQGFIVQADLTDEVQIGEMFEEIAKKIGPLDAVVNNAGEAIASDFFDNKLWQSQFENIFFSALHVSQQFIGQNKKAEMRKIINIASIYGNLNTGNTEFFAYSVAKTALESLTVNLAKMSPKILVNAIAPGYVWTPPWEGISKKEKKLYESRTMIGRFIMPEEIAHIAVAVLENDALTGQVLTVDGGLGLQKLERK